ncbi:hypothetical protein OC844_007068 [Tilletia horrida]|nr:hypothetical protein OC844_007068 [Tilletia horrida]
MRVQSASHAGRHSWYTSDGFKLNKALEERLDAVRGEQVPPRHVVHWEQREGSSSSAGGGVPVPVPGWRAIIALKRVSVLGASHHVYLDGGGLSICDGYETPIGALPLDKPKLDDEDIEDVPLPPSKFSLLNPTSATADPESKAAGCLFEATYSDEMHRFVKGHRIGCIVLVPAALNTTFCMEAAHYTYEQCLGSSVPRLRMTYLHIMDPLTWHLDPARARGPALVRGRFLLLRRQALAACRRQLERLLQRWLQTGLLAAVHGTWNANNR